MPEQPTPTPVAPVPEEPQRAEPLASAVAEAVGKLRRTAGLSERAAARKLGTSQTQLRRMEDPRYLPSLRSLARVAAAYGYKIDVTFGPLDEKKKAPVAVPARKRVTEPKAQRATEAKAQRAAPRKGRGRS